MSDTDKREAILLSAFEVFKKKGFHSAKIEDIAKNAGIGKGTIYEYFSSKKEIFEKAFINNLQSGYIETKKIFEDECCFKEKLAKYLEYKYNYITIQSSLAENFLAHGELISRNIKETFFKFMIKHTEDLTKLIEQGIEENVLKENIDKEILVSCILGISNNYIGMNAFFKKDKKLDYNKIIDSLLEGFDKNKEDYNEK